MNDHLDPDVIRTLFSQAMPDDHDTLSRDGLAFYRCRTAGSGRVEKAASIDALIASGALIADPQVYEDFLPVSAAGIFQSNLASDDQSNSRRTTARPPIRKLLKRRLAQVS